MSSDQTFGEQTMVIVIEWFNHYKSHGFDSLVQAMLKSGFFAKCKTDKERILISMEILHFAKMMHYDDLFNNEQMAAMGWVETIHGKMVTDFGITSVMFQRDLILWLETHGVDYSEYIQNKLKISEWKSLKQVQGYIYLIKGVFNNPTYKIGYSKNPKKRIHKFDVVLPFPIEVQHLIKTDHMKAAEAYLHDKYSDKRVNGEWFELTEQDVADIRAIETLNAEDIA